MFDDDYTFASAMADCPVHSKQHEEFEAQYAQYQDELQRLNRRLLRQLDLPGSRSARAVNV
ncbi:hypothetical protein [Streptomyces osmaniensis]|uniref:Uncharacterized protein n=1 Tax=Streptomyces osmaniensis TaxID=593134 RepID=A0ABP6YU17_9ACTN|nr:hypothetical protein KJK32_47140 [Streptomyces sp. JCM17656]